MKYTYKKQKLDYLLELIQKEKTGNAEHLCKKIYVSKATLKRYLHDLREMGQRISYCLQRGTYYIITAS
jgi:predicted DNA-binding transcriptional regulator YafY